MDVFCQRLQQLRKRKGLSQRALGELCGLSKSVIATYELDARMPSAQSLIALADFFNVSTDYLLGRDSYSTRS